MNTPNHDAIFSFSWKGQINRADGTGIFKNTVTGEVQEINFPDFKSAYDFYIFLLGGVVSACEKQENELKECVTRIFTGFRTGKKSI